jgi:uncharacterized protein
MGLGQFPRENQKEIAMTASKAGSRPVSQSPNKRSALSSSREVRFLPEVRAVADAGKPRQIIGHAAVFNTYAQLKGFRERILPGAFTRAIEQKDDTVCLWNHDSNKVLGRTTSGTLRLTQDSRGLQYVCDLPDTIEGQSFHEAIRRGDVTGSSFSFNVSPEDETWEEAQDPEDRSYFVRRSIKSVTHLYDCSPVLRPAYGDATDVVARSAVVVPVELRSRVEELNQTSHLTYKKHFVMPTVEECRAINERAQKRHAGERIVKTRRRNLVNDILNS